MVELQGGVETLTVTGADPGHHLRVVDSLGADVVTMVVDDAGNAHLAFVPPEHCVLREPREFVEALSTGHTLAPGDYTVIDDSTDPPTAAGHRARARRRRDP